VKDSCEENETEKRNGTPLILPARRNTKKPLFLRYIELKERNLFQASQPSSSGT
jgi:hypothetical protein